MNDSEESEVVKFIIEHLILAHSGPYLHINKEFSIDDDFTDEFINETRN